MEIRVHAPGRPRAWSVAMPSGTTLGALAELVGITRHGAVAVDGRVLPPELSVEEAGVVAGSLLEPAGAAGGPLELLIEAPGAPPRRHPLTPGRHVVGRHPSVDVLLLDPEVRARHVDLWVGDDGQVRVCAPGTDTPVAMSNAGGPDGVLGAGDEVTIGDTRLRVELVVAPAAAPLPPRLVHNRPPRPVPAVLPELPPARPEPPAAPARSATIRTLATMLVPSLAGVAIAALLRPALAGLALLAPAGALLTWLVLAALDVQAARAHRRALVDAEHAHQAAWADAAAGVAAVLEGRHPRLDEVAARIDRRDPRLWERRPAHDDFLRLPIGVGEVRLQGASGATHTVTAPVEVDLLAPVGIIGDRARTLPLARALLLHAAAHHGPADVVVQAWTRDPGAWRWLRWLPHLADGPDRAVCSDTDVLDDDADRSCGGPHRLLVLDAGGLPATWRPAWRRALERGAGVVLAPTAEELPEECRTVIRLGDDGGSVCDVDGPSAVPVHERWTLDEAHAEELAARLAPLRDPDVASARVLPSATGLLPLLGACEGGAAALEDLVPGRWACSRRSGRVAAPLGVDAGGPVLVDLVEHGPHALVAGTTGSGKSELLRSLVLGLAASVDAEHLAFVLVDYKGGSAFDGLQALPHVVDVVTDLDTVSARRALHGLEAEVLRRERLLRDAGVPDIAAYQAARRERAVDAPLPRLAIVVDEFATLGLELPSFVDALVDVAQRGRSLGVHLVLATQRPNGAVKDTIRTNTNLRIALRVLDAHDSRDVLGVDDAASISRAAKGRAIARLGAGELRPFQSVYTGGPAPRSGVGALRAVPAGLPMPAGEAEGPDERSVLVEAVRTAHRAGRLAEPRRPWSDPLPGRVTLAVVAAAAAAAGPARGPALGLVDDVDEQVHRPWTWEATGNLLVAGLAGSGATDALTTCAASVRYRPEAQRPYVYVLSASPAAFDAVAGLAHVGSVVAHDDTERVQRLLRMLTTRVGAARTGRGDDREVLVLVDGIGALRATYDTLAGVELLDRFERLVADGPATGVRFAFAAGHPADLGHRLDRSVTQRVLLRLGDRNDYASAGVRDVEPATMPRGRGIDAATGRWVQLAQLDDADLARLTARTGCTDAPEVIAPAVDVLPAGVDAAALPLPGADSSGSLRLPLGIGDHDLTPAVVVLAPGEHLLVVGGPRSGKSAVLATLAIRARSAGIPVIVIGTARSRGEGVLRARDEIAATVQALVHRTSSTPVLVLVDDADAVDDAGALDRLLGAAPSSVHVVAAARTDRLRPLYRHWTSELRRGSSAVLLRGDDHDADLVGVRLPRGVDATRAGCGWLVSDGQVERCQFAFAGCEGSPS
jgi:S-DNA-T family DNA segregation ATPase FtsK/SpoIIIE